MRFHINVSATKAIHKRISNPNQNSIYHTFNESYGVSLYRQIFTLITLASIVSALLSSVIGKSIPQVSPGKILLMLFGQNRVAGLAARTSNYGKPKCRPGQLHPFVRQCYSFAINSPPPKPFVFRANFRFCGQSCWRILHLLAIQTISRRLQVQPGLYDLRFDSVLVKDVFHYRLKPRVLGRSNVHLFDKGRHLAFNIEAAF